MRDPILIGFVGRFSSEAVDEQIFGRAAVLDAVAEIDFQAANAGNALDARELGFALL